MDRIIKITYNEEHNQPVVTSLQVAEDFEKEHKTVLRSIENLVAQNCAAKSWFYECAYENRGRQYPMYLMNRDGFSLLVMGFTGKEALNWKVKYIEAFNQMEQQIQNNLLNKPENIIKALLQASDNNTEEIKGIKQELKNHEENHELTRAEYDHLSAKVANRIKQVKQVRDWTLNPKQCGVLKHGINGDICRYMGVRTRTMIARKDFEKACLFVEGWDPSSVTLKEIEEFGDVEN